MVHIQGIQRAVHFKVISRALVSIVSAHLVSRMFLRESFLLPGYDLEWHSPEHTFVQWYSITATFNKINNQGYHLYKCNFKFPSPRMHASKHAAHTVIAQAHDDNEDWNTNPTMRTLRCFMSDYIGFPLI